MIRQMSQMKLVRPNFARQCRYGHRRAILKVQSCKLCVKLYDFAFITVLVFKLLRSSKVLFTKAKFVELNLFYLARLPILHC